jgi:hypothetical protein
MGNESPEDIKEILDVVSEKVPQLLNDITDALFNPEKSKEFGKTVAEFYKSMVESGMSPDQAFELTKKFMDSSSPGGMIGKALGGIGGGGGPVNKTVHIHGGNDCGDFGNGIEKKIKIKMAKKMGEEGEDCCED